MSLMKEFGHLVQSVVMAFRYIRRVGFKGLRWPHTNHSEIVEYHSPQGIGVLESELFVALKSHPLLKWLEGHKKDYFLRVEVGLDCFWIGVYKPVHVDPRDGWARPIYNEWKGKDGTFHYIVSKEGGAKKVTRPIPGVGWVEQAPLLNIKCPLMKSVEGLLFLKEGEVL